MYRSHITGDIVFSNTSCALRVAMDAISIIMVIIIFLFIVVNVITVNNILHAKIQYYRLMSHIFLKKHSR